MRVSKNQVALLSAAVAAIFASAAQAQVNLDAVGGAVPAARYATEIRGPLAIPQFALPPAVSPTDVKSKIGVGIATAGTLRFARFDLTNATFTAASTQVFTQAGINANVIAGGAGSSFVIFQLSATAPILQTDTFVMSGGSAAAAPAYTIASFDGPATIRYRLYEFAQNALNTPDTTAQILYQNSGTLFNASPALRLNNNAGGLNLPAGSLVSTLTASSAASYLRFTTGVARGTLGSVGVVVDTSPGVGIGGAILDATGTAVGAGTVAAILDQTSTGSTISVAGDFTATGATPAGVRLGLGGAPSDPTTIGGAASVTATSAVFNGSGATGLASPFANAVLQPGTTASADGATNNLQFYATGTTAIPASDYVMSLNAVALAGYRAIPYSARTNGRIGRDGSALMSPWFSISTGYISRFFLTNTSAVAFPCTVVLYGETGNTLTPGTVTTVTVPANGSINVAATDILASALTASRAAAVFNCNAPRTNVNGSYVLTNAAAGSVTTHVMVTPGTN